MPEPKDEDRQRGGFPGKITAMDMQLNGKQFTLVGSVLLSIKKDVVILIVIDGANILLLARNRGTTHTSKTKGGGMLLLLGKGLMADRSVE